MSDFNDVYAAIDKIRRQERLELWLRRLVVALVSAAALVTVSGYFSVSLGLVTGLYFIGFVAALLGNRNA